ncbi:hypothetical protein ACMYSQ_002212 [Aspergillus niger]
MLCSDLAGVPSDKMTPCGERPLLVTKDPFLAVPGITRSGVEYSTSSGSPCITGLAGDIPNELPESQANCGNCYSVNFQASSFPTVEYRAAETAYTSVRTRFSVHSAIEIEAINFSAPSQSRY